ncbi:Adenylosuccinate synthase [Lecanicillium sp. MT-2017a]|nr:Adenylosuccinate synthase [Lecanicillium sp. MT-2017a]
MSNGPLENKIGTTQRGIGPSYAARAARSGIRLAEVFNRELFETKLRRLEAGYRKRFGDLFVYDIEEELARFDEYRPKLAKYAVDAVSFIRSAQESNKNIVVEGANSTTGKGIETRHFCLSPFEQALMLDLSYGSYPFVTSSDTTLAGIIGGLALNPKNITDVIGVVKAYLVVVKYSTSINYYTALNLTKLDVLDDFDTIKIAIAYKVDGQELDSYPADLDTLEKAEVVYHEMPGWKTPTTNARTFYDLPKAARDYVEYIENFVGVKIKWIGTGPDREAMIKRA